MKCSRALEIQPDRSLEETSLSALVLYRSEGRVSVDIQNRTRRHRMVEDVGRVHSKLQVLRFADVDRFAQRSIERPGTREFQRRTTKRTSRSRFGILQQDLSGTGVGDGLNRA